MDEEIERLVVRVRADTAAFARDVGAMRAVLDGPFADGAERAGRAIETTLLRAVRTGKLGFEDLRRAAVSVLDAIAASAMRGRIDVLLGGGRGGASGAGGGALPGILGSLLGAPGRATGGPVSPDRPYWVGERGPELFVPTASGSVAVPGSGGGTRDVRIAITINAGGGDAPRALAQSSRQVARAVRAALADAE